MGHKPTTSNEDFLLSLRNKIDSLPKQEDRAFALRLARTLHAVLFLKEGHSARTWDAESVVEQAGKGEWGFSCTNVPEMTACMWQGSLFFSDNKLQLHSSHLKNIVNVLDAFGDFRRMKIAATLFRLTCSEEKEYVTAGAVAEQCGISEETITEIFENELAPFLREKTEKGNTIYRFDGQHMHILPILSMFSV